jgi:hypothetical protein
MLSNDYLVYSSSATETTDKMTDAKKASKTTIVGYVVLVSDTIMTGLTIIIWMI